jgi:hypothetical protein
MLNFSVKLGAKQLTVFEIHNQIITPTAAPSDP